MSAPAARAPRGLNASPAEDGASKEPPTGWIPIASPLDPRVRLFGSVRDPILLSRHGLFVAESRFVVGELLASRSYQAVAVLVTPTVARCLEASLRGLPAAAPVYVAEPNVLRDIAGFPVHRGCLALGRRLVEPTLSSLATPAGSAPARPLVVLEAVADPDNVGSIFRSAYAFGVGGVVVDARCADPLYRKAIRVSLGKTLRVPFCRVPHSAAEALESLRRQGYRTLGLTPQETARDLRELCADACTAMGGPVAVVLGNEGAGLTDATLAACDVRVRIGMVPDADSLNVATAAAVVLHRLYSEYPAHRRAG